MHVFFNFGFVKKKFIVSIGLVTATFYVVAPKS